MTLAKVNGVLTGESMISRRLTLMAASLLMLAGCTTGNPSLPTQRITIAKGQSVVQTFQLVAIAPDGRAEFRAGPWPEQYVKVGESFGLQREAGRHHGTEYTIQVLSTDQEKQQATLLVQTREYRTKVHEKTR